MDPLCNLSRKLPLLVGSLLDRENVLGKGRFREETFTDILSGAFAGFAGPSLVIEYPPEAQTGGDIDLDFFHASSGRTLALRIQAKRLNGAVNSKGGLVKADVRSYEHLLHEVAHPITRVKEYQYRTLARITGRLPLYMFYNHASVVADPYYVASVPAVRGINLAFAYDISIDMDAKLAKAPGAHYNKRLSKLRRHFFELDALFCPCGDSDGGAGEDVPSPDLVSERLRECWMRGRAGDGARANDERVMRLLTRPDSLDARSVAFQRLPDGPSIRVNDGIECPRITLISGRTEDDRTPDITDAG